VATGVTHSPSSQARSGEPMCGGCCWWQIDAEDGVVVPRSAPTPTLVRFSFGPVLAGLLLGGGCCRLTTGVVILNSEHRLVLVNFSHRSMVFFF
jgi:hypothetical protein